MFQAPQAAVPRELPLLPNDSERKLLGLLLRNGPMTQAQVTRAMDLTQPTVSRLVTGLVDRGMISLGARAVAGRGQPSAHLHLQRDFAYTIGISILGDCFSFDVMDFSGVPVWRASEALPGMRRSDVLARLAATKAQMLAETAIAPARLAAAGVGVSAFFVGEGGLMNPPPLLDEWALIDIAPLISQALDLPVTVDNDGNVACLGEAMCGAGRRFHTFAYFQITNGFGGGVVIDGAPYRGAHGNAGEFAALWQAVGIEHPNLERLRVLLVDHAMSFATVADMLATPLPLDHPGVEAWLAEAVPAFSLAATAAAAALDCEAIVLGGRIPKPLAKELARRITIAHTTRRDRPLPRPVIVLAETPGDAVSLGAAALAFQRTYFA
jgi:predicted NBD/HSP70 family sugar kinase